MKYLKTEQLATMKLGLSGDMGGEEVKLTIENGLVLLNGCVIGANEENLNHVIRKDYQFVCDDEDGGNDEEDLLPCVSVHGYDLFILEGV